MYKCSLIVVLVLFSYPAACLAQKKQKDTITKYINGNLEFTRRSSNATPALAIRGNGMWLLLAVYPDTSLFLRVYFSDDALQIKNGPFEMYFPGRAPAARGQYANNVKQGPWVYYHKNGKLKDSGSFKNNHMTGEWKSWLPDGSLNTIAHYQDEADIQDTARGWIVSANQKKNYLLAGDTTIGILNGHARHFYSSGKLMDSGSYVQHKKSGHWKYFYETGIVESAGLHVQGRAEGEWVYYRENGVLSSREQYSKGKVVSLQCFDTLGNPAGISCPILKPPVAQGPFLDFTQFALNNLYWPEELEKTDITGEVRVEYTITKEGKMTDFRILSSPHKAMSEEVTRFFNTLEWSPAVSHNRPIDQKMTFTAPFYR